MHSHHKICTFQPWAIRPPAQVFECKKWRHDRKSILIKKSTKAAERVHGILASQITRHSIFSILHILRSPDTQDHISSFPTALAKLHYLSWHIDWLVQNAVWRHILTVFCYCTCQIQFVFCERHHPMSLLQIWSLNFRCLCACSLEFIVTMQCAEMPHSPYSTQRMPFKGTPRNTL